MVSRKNCSWLEMSQKPPQPRIGVVQFLLGASKHVFNQSIQSIPAETHPSNVRNDLICV